MTLGPVKVMGAGVVVIPCALEVYSFAIKIHMVHVAMHAIVLIHMYIIIMLQIVGLNYKKVNIRNNV